MENMKKGLYFLLLIIALPKGYTQILNADAFGTPVDSSHAFKAVIDFGMELNKQNSLILSFDTKADLSYWFKNNVLISTSQFSLFRSGSQNLINGGFSHLRFRLRQDLWIHPEIFTQYQLDGIRGMTERFLVGGNLRFRLKEYDKGAFYIGAGGMYEYECWNYDGVPDNIVIVDKTPIQNHFGKFNLYLSYRQKLGKLADINSILYFQTRLDSYFFSPRISTDIQLTFNISKHLSFAMQYNVFFDAAPVVPIYNWYYSMINKIVFTF
jgi:hypothetical protein